MAKMEERHTLAVRFFHWWNVVAILALIFSGFYIHNPHDLAFRWMFADMDAARKIHFIFMYCAIAGLIGRLYYAFATGDYKNFTQGPKDMANMVKLALYYLWFTDEEPDWGGKYNPGQKGMYAAFAPLLMIQIYTGMILYWPANFAWWGGWLGGVKWIRVIHYIVAWIFVYCILGHIYLDFSEGIPGIVAMFTGKRPVHERYHHVSPPVHRAVRAVKG